MQKFPLPMQKNFAQLLEIEFLSKNDFWQQGQKCKCCKQNFSSCKIVCMKLQKTLFAALKAQAQKSKY